MYHFRVKVIGRSSGRTAAGATAYRTGGRSPASAIAYRVGGVLKDRATGTTYDYRAKGRIDRHGFGVRHTEILAPSDARAWVFELQALLDRVEAAEKRKDAQLFRELEISLPRELSLEDQKALVRSFVARECVPHGMAAIVAIHNERASDGGENPHAHILLTMRPLRPEGFGPKNRDWNSRNLVRDWREAWAAHANELLARRGFARRLDHRSFKDREIEVEPDRYVGPGTGRDIDGVIVDQRRLDRAAAREWNRTRAEDPAWVLEQLSRMQSTFTASDIAAFLRRHAGLQRDDPDLSAMTQAVLTCGAIVRIAADTKGPDRFTTRAVLDCETRMAKSADRLAARQSGLSTIGPLQGLSTAQQEAAAHLIGGPALTLLEGAAGSGKTHLLASVRERLEANGHRVRGAALSALVARNLSDGAGMPAQTIHQLLRDLDRDRPFAPLSSQDVVIVDETGLVGSRQLEAILRHVDEAGARVVLVGDSRQLQAIEAGAAFRSLVERHGAARLAEVRRQTEDWQKHATHAFAAGRTAEALHQYQSRGAVHAAASAEAAMAAMVEEWCAHRHSGESQIMLAHRRTDAAKLNLLARAQLRAAGELGAEISVGVTVTEDVGGRLTERTERRRFAAGDQIMFTRNDRTLDVQNGALGRIADITPEGLMQIGLRDGRTITIDPASYQHLEQGYALTVHKAQGVTVDRSYVYASYTFDAHLTYVAMTRHRKAVDLYYAQSEFDTLGGFEAALTRQRPKDTTLDYQQTLGYQDFRHAAPAPTSVLDIAAQPLDRPKTKEEMRRDRALALLAREREERALQKGRDHERD